MISILTPTKDREHLLPAIRACVESQTIQDIEWLVHDGSPSPSPFLSGLADERVRYIHDPQPMTIGAKRNALVKEAHGDILIHFDDDDHYAPHYIETMLTLMATSGADIVKLFGFHLFHRRTGMFAYWDLQNAFPLHHMLHPDADDFPLGPKSQKPNEEWGYGFSYVYRRKVWEAHPFPDTSDGEDQQFAVNAISQFKHAGMQDTGFVAVHVIHGSNTSYAYPQQLLPQAFGEAYFPGFTPEALMSQDAQMKEHAFPNLRETNYRLFDDDLENDAHVFFHATHADNFAAITQSGFKLPLPTRENPYPAVSFAKNSTWSLTWAMGKRNEQPGEWVMFAVRYDDLAGLDDQGIDVHDRKLKPQPTIIGYCRIPESYRHI